MATGDFSIAPAHWPQDLEAARNLLTHYGQFLSASKVGATGLCLIGYEAELNALPGKFGTGDADFLLARFDGEAAGCVAIFKRVLPDGRLGAEIKRLWTEPAFRGRGLGRTLIQAAIAWAQSHQCQAVVLDTIEDAMPEAAALYQSLDFQETGRFNDNPIPGVRFFILMLRT
jgi:putative acetyltransferase